MNISWWKVLAIILLSYSIVGGIIFDVPRLAIVNETIRALYFHVPMWFGMVFMFFISLIYSIRYLRNPKLHFDSISVEFANTGIIFGLLGIATGMIWANFTWGTPWHGDPKQNGAAITLLVYLAYSILRQSLPNIDQRAKLSGVYNIFAFTTMIPMIFIIPRLSSSMHPGSGGNPGFNMYDLDSQMRMVFYPAIIGWILLGVWIAILRIRFNTVDMEILNIENEKDL